MKVNELNGKEAFIRFLSEMRGERLYPRDFWILGEALGMPETTVQKHANYCERGGILIKRHRGGYWVVNSLPYNEMMLVYMIVRAEDNEHTKKVEDAKNDVLNAIDQLVGISEKPRNQLHHIIRYCRNKISKEIEQGR